jgi:hypothetical protein
VDLTSTFFVEPPGIEPSPKIALTCRDTEIEYALRRVTTPMTCGYAEGVDGINSAAIKLRGRLDLADPTVLPVAWKSDDFRVADYPCLTRTDPLY